MKTINNIRKQKLSNFTEKFTDDIFLFSPMFTEHSKHLSLALEAIPNEGFRLKFCKSKFAQDSVNYLGVIIKK